ncbi:MAG: hypothetical protein JWO65_116 [Sphingomonas bacterium]|nr:hypothetical protein [Sphingomonas bacterium]
MPLALSDTQFDTDLDALLRLQAILLQAAEGARGPELDHEYKELRRILLEDDTYSDVIPAFARRYRDLGSLWPALKSFSPQWEPRRVEVRNQFEGALATAERIEFFGKSGEAPTGYDSSAWTGAIKGSDRVKAVKTLLPIARNAVEHLIATLEAPRHNGGPPLDEMVAAIKDLRQLHRALGEMLIAADQGKLADAFNDGLPTEAARYAKRAARALRDDPMPYAVSAAVLAIMTACGVPGIGGYLAGVAISMKKK